MSFAKLFDGNHRRQKRLATLVSSAPIAAFKEFEPEGFLKAYGTALACSIEYQVVGILLKSGIPEYRPIAHACLAEPVLRLSAYLAWYTVERTIRCDADLLVSKAGFIDEHGDMAIKKMQQVRQKMYPDKDVIVRSAIKRTLKNDLQRVGPGPTLSIATLALERQCIIDYCLNVTPSASIDPLERVIGTGPYLLPDTFRDFFNAYTA